MAYITTIISAIPPPVLLAAEPKLISPPCLPVNLSSPRVIYAHVHAIRCNNTCNHVHATNVHPIMHMQSMCISSFTCNHAHEVMCMQSCSCNHAHAIMHMQSCACYHAHAITRMQSRACNHMRAITPQAACACAEVSGLPGVRRPTDANAAVRVAQMLQLTGFIHSHTPGVGGPRVLLQGRQG